MVPFTRYRWIPHVFVGGRHIGDLFSGTDEGGPGVFSTLEADELKTILPNPYA